LRIAIDFSHYLIPGGIRTLLGNQLRALLAVAPEHDYTLCYRGLGARPEAPPLPQGAPVRTAWIRAPRRVLSACEHLLGWPPVQYWTGPIDVYHGTHFALPPARGARRVLTVQDLAYLRMPELYADRRLNDYGYRVLLPRALAAADGIIAISHATAHDLAELRGIAAERIWVIPLGIDPRFGRPAPEDAAHAPAALDDGRRYVLYPAGTLEPRKNIDNVLRAFARAFPSRGNRPRLVITGVGGLPRRSVELARALRVGEDVRCIEADYPAGIAALMRGAAWGMYLSLYEGFGLPVLEGMACGMPLLVSRVSSIPEVAGDAAMFVDPRDIEAIADGMRTLDGSDALRAALAAKGRARAALPGFAWERAARQLAAAYRDDAAAFGAEPDPCPTEA